MKITIIVLLSINVALTELNSTNHINRGLISNGVVYDPEKYPYLVTVVSYDIDDFHNLCSGTLLSELYVLTAAHCVHDSNINKIKVNMHMQCFHCNST